MRGVVEVVAVLLEPVADHRQQRTVSRTRDADVLTTDLHELCANAVWDVKHSPARADGIIQAGR